jgi:hypothetical protein
MATTTFFTAANRTYDHFIIPYITSALSFNKGCFVEICVEDEAETHQKYEPALAALKDCFGDQFLIRTGDFSRSQPSVVRFIEPCRVKSEFIYIGDIDILYLENVPDKHIPKMRAAGLRYSNMVRPNLPGQNRLTGLHFSEWDFYYPVIIPEDVDLSEKRWGFDEALLYRMVGAKGEPPSRDYDYRELHGFHVSHHGWPLSRSRGWCLTVPGYRAAYETLRASAIWQAVLPQMSPKYRVLLDLVDISYRALDIFPPGELAGTYALSGQ